MLFDGYKESVYTIYTRKRIAPIFISLIADLHGKPYYMAMDSLSKYHPDIIAIVGDVVNYDYDIDPLELFRLCSLIAPTFFALGNHERKITDKQINDINRTGTIVLDNTWIKFRNFYIGGMTSPFANEWRETEQAILHYTLPRTSWLAKLYSRKSYE